MDSTEKWSWVKVLAEVTQCFQARLNCTLALPQLFCVHECITCLCSWVFRSPGQVLLPSGALFTVKRLACLILYTLSLADFLHSLALKILAMKTFPQRLISWLNLTNHPLSRWKYPWSPTHSSEHMFLIVSLTTTMLCPDSLWTGLDPHLTHWSCTQTPVYAGSYLFPKGFSDLPALTSSPCRPEYSVLWL